MDKISTLSDAKEFFEQAGCSRFHMSRVDHDIYLEYQSLNISIATESLWRAEEIVRISQLLVDTEKEANLKAYNYLADLCEAQKDGTALVIILDVTKKLFTRFSPEQAIMAGQAIVGTAAYHFESGLIYSAYSLGMLGTAKEFGELAIQLCEQAKLNSRKPIVVADIIAKSNKVLRHFGLISLFEAIARKFKNRR